MPTEFAALAREWRARFAAGRRAFRWVEDRLDNGYCAECRHCCGPQPEGDAPYPMPLLPSQRRPDLADDFYLLSPSVACLDQRGCKALTPTGCRLERRRRPPACNLFPLIINEGALYFYQICPAVLFADLDTLLRIGEDAARDLPRLYTPDELRAISTPLTPESLIHKCISLDIRIYEQAENRARPG